MKVWLCVIGILVLLSDEAFGACSGGPVAWTSTPDQASIDSCLSQANSGDTITVSAGTETWTTNKTIPAGVKVVGAGISSTIVNSVSNISITVSSSAWFEGFTLNNGYALGASRSNSFVIKDCAFDNTTGTKVTFNQNAAYGVFNGCSFSGYDIAVHGLSNGEEEFYQATDERGSSYATFIENCTFSYGSVSSGTRRMMDGDQGGSLVFRFNTVTDMYILQHGARDSTQRGPRRLEFYRNTTNKSDAETNYVTWFRGGSIIEFDQLCNATGTDIDGCDFKLGLDTGRNSLCGPSNAWDTTPHPGTGIVGSVLCRDTLAGGQDISQSPQLPSDQVNQTYRPTYVWNLSVPGYAVDFDVSEESECETLGTCYIENRDYFVDSTIGSGGVTSGLYVNRPSTCTKYHGYWATDMGNNWNSNGTWNGETGVDGALYVCNWSGAAPNTWELYYTPTAYPHPLLGGTTTPPSATGCTISGGSFR